MRATPKLLVERMEDRCVPATFGNTWIDTNLTVSFVPDGTDVAGGPSTLHQTLGARATPVEWQGAIRAAFRAWATPTNLNFAFVPDDGRPVGSPGPVQGSPHVGDIRISARPLSDNVLAVTNPFDLVSPWAGEIILNSNKVFDTDGSAGASDLRTVLLQEIGHALGVGNSPDPASVMYEYYAGPRAGLSAGDAAAIQDLYGKPGLAGLSVLRVADQTFQTASGVVSGTLDWTLGFGVNETVRTATDLGQSRDADDRRWDFAGTARLARAADVDVFEVYTRERAGGTMVVSVGTPTGGVEPKVTVFDRTGKPVKATVLFRNGDATIVQITGVSRHQSYYVAVTAADPTKWTGVERYHLGIDFRDTAVTLAPFADVTFSAAQPVVAQTLHVNRSQGFRFQLAAAGPADASATLTVYDADRKVVFTLTAVGGQTLFGDVLLAPGEYTVAVRGTPGLHADARFLTLTDPIGLAEPSDPTTDPNANRVAPPPAEPEPFVWTHYDPAYYAWLM